MKKFFQKTGLKLQRFMAGRYGIDDLWKALLVFYFIVIIIANIVFRFSKVSYWALVVMSLVILIWALFRAFSKNIEARRNENAAWMRFWNKITGFFRFQSMKLKQRKTHKFVKCKKCKKVLRLPKNKGKIEVTCPHCRSEFVVNTGRKKTAGNK